MFNYHNPMKYAVQHPQPPRKPGRPPRNS